MRRRSLLPAPVRIVAGWIAAVWIAAATAPTVTAADPRPSWECLPEHTAFMLRLPQPAEFLATIRGRTKFGAVVLEERRLDAAWRLLLESARDAAGDDESAAGEEFTRQLARYGLEPGDLAAAFRGDMGVAGTVRRRPDGGAAFFMLLAWLEPGVDAATRLVEAAKRQFEEQQAEASEPPGRRIDLEMAGHEAVWFIEPAMGLDRRLFDDQDGEAGDPETRMQRLRERITAAKTVQIGQTHSFVARLGGRLLVGQTLPPAAPAGDAAQPRDFDAESGTEEARATFESFLAAHAEAGRAPLAEIMQAPGARELAPGGAVLVDAVLDPRVLLAAYGDDAATRRLFEQTGLDALGPLVWRQSFDAGACRGGVFLSLPAPRRGPLAVLDQPCDAAEVPSFVGRDVTDFTQISLDLAGAYRTVREFATAAGGERAANLFQTAEMQSSGWLGIDLERLLASFGSRHWIVTYATNVAEALADARARRGSGPLQPQLVDRVAVVWQVADEAPLVKLLGRLAPLAGGQLAEEQGFRGFRGPGGAAAHVGHGHFVVDSAKAVEATLAAIRNPPSGEASLRDGDVVGRARELVPQTPARVFGVSDARRSGGTLGLLRDFAANLRPEDVAEPLRDRLSRLQSLLPGAADMEDSFGVGTLLVTPADAGIVCRFAWEMPPP